MNTHTCDPADPISNLGLLTTYKFEYDENRIHEGGAMWAMAHFVADRFASSLNSPMVQSDETKGSATAVNFNRAIIQVYFETVNHLHKRYTYDETIAKANAAILRFKHSTNMTPLQHCKVFFPEDNRVRNLNDEGTLNDTFIEGVDESICDSLCGNCVTHTNADLTDHGFQDQSLLAIQCGSTRKDQPPPNNGTSNYQSRR